MTPETIQQRSETLLTKLGVDVEEARKYPEWTNTINGRIEIIQIFLADFRAEVITEIITLLEQRSDFRGARILKNYLKTLKSA